MAQLISGTTIAGYTALHTGNIGSYAITSLSGYATQSYVTTQISNLINGAPGALDTLNELAAALGNDASFSSTITNSLAAKLSLSGGTLTGKVLFPSAVSNRPQFPGGILGLDTGDGNFDIWGISRDYYPSNSTASNAWGLRWNGDNNDFEFVGGGSNRVVLDMDGGNLTASGIVYASGGNSGNWNTAYGWGNHAGLYSALGHTHDDRYYTETESDNKYLYYRGVNQVSDFQSLQDASGEIRFDQINDFNNLSNRPGGYNYGGVLSMRGANFGFQLWGSHTGDFYYKTQWSDDQYSGWRQVITSLNIGSQSVSYASSAGSATSAGTVTHNGSRTDGTWYNAVWAAGSPSPMYSADSVQIRSSDGAIRANIFYDNQNTAYYVDPNSSSRLYLLGLGGATPDAALSVSGTAHVDGTLYLGGTAGTVNSWGTRTTGGSGYWRTSARDVAFNNEGYGSSWTFFINSAGAVTLNRHIDANTTWGSASGNTLFVGWYGGKIVLGNNSDSGHDYASAITAQSIVSTNRHYFYKGASLNNTVQGAEVFTVDGINGRLFTVTDDLSDSLFSVNTIAGLPVIEAFADNTVKIGPYSAPITISASGISTTSHGTSANWLTAYNKRPTGVSFSGSSTKTLTLTLGDGSTLTAAFNDIDTDTNTDSQTLSLSGNTLSISGGNSVTLSSSGLSQATADTLYIRKNTWEGNSYIGTGGDIYGTIFYDSNDSAYYMNPNGRSNINALTANGKEHYFGTSGGWDGVGFGNLTNVHMQGHGHFWFGAGNAYWWNGGINTEHDLLITTMYGYDSKSYYRGITFAVENNGNGSSGGYRLGRWQTYGTAWNTARLQVDASLSVGYGNRIHGGSYNEGAYPLDRGVWAMGRDQVGYGDDRVRSKLFSPTANGGGPWGSFASLEVSSILDGNNDIPALFRMHQWGSGSVEFWKPQGTTLYIRESPGGSGSWFTRLEVQGSHYVTSSQQAYSYQGHSNVAGTGNASYHPSGIYSTGTNWLYGTMYLNNNVIYDIGTAYASGSFRAPIFYDSENTAFYLDPTSSSRLRYLYVGDSGSNWSNPGGWDTTVYISGPSHAIIRVENRGNNYHSAVHSHTGQLPGVGSPGDYDYRITRNWDNRMIFYSGYTYAYGYLQAGDSLRAPIFYDSENTGYYVDPNGSSRMATINADYIRSYGNARVDSNLYLDQQYGSSIVGAYASTRYQGVFAMGDSYKLAIDGSGTGTLYGMAWSHPNAGGVAGNLNTHGLLVMENGTFLAAISGSIRARDDMRAPALYDSGSRVAISRGEGRNYVDYSRYVYNNGAYSGTGWTEPSDLGVRYANTAGSAPANGGTSTYATYLNPLSGDGNYKLAYTANGARTNAGEWGRAVMYYVPNGQTYGIRVDRADYSDSSGSANSVAWSNVSGRPTALSEFSNNLGNYGGWITSSGSISGSSGSTNAVNSTGWGNGNFTWYQTPSGLSPYTGSWASFLVSNHGDGSNYYNQTIIMPFWGAPQYSRREGGNNRGPWTFWTTENLDPNNIGGNFYASGTITAGGDVVAYSDIRLKTNIKTIENALDKTLALRGVSYNRIDSEDNKTKIGVIAQETLEVIPEVVNQDANGMYNVSYGNMTALLIEAIKEQQAQIEDLKAEIKKLRGE